MARLRLHIVNPNTTASMTQAHCAGRAYVAAPAGVEITASEPEFGPASIEGFYDGAFAVPGMLARIAEAEKAGCDAHVIACFDDTGLDAGRSAALLPWSASGKRRFMSRSMIGRQFFGRNHPFALDPGDTKPTSSLRARPSLCSGASERATGALAGNPSPRRRKTYRRGDRTSPKRGRRRLHRARLRRHGDLAERFSARFQVPVVDGVAAGVGLATALARLSLKTSKAGGYAAPGPKAYSGLFERFSPKPDQC